MSQIPLPPKPRSDFIRSEITRLPPLTKSRQLFRRMLTALARLLVALLTRTQVFGLENLPRRGPALLAINHLGDADFVVGLAVTPVTIDLFAKAELYNYPLLGKVLEAYGVIWIHRGQPDRKALRAAFQGLQEGRILSIAPEGRESLNGALEEGTEGAAYLALKGDVPVVPVTLTGTENKRIFSNLRGFRRTKVTLTIGPPFHLEQLRDRHAALQQGTVTIMHTLARQLPVEYRGVYGKEVEKLHDCQ